MGEIPERRAVEVWHFVKVKLGVGDAVLYGLSLPFRLDKDVRLAHKDELKVGEQERLGVEEWLRDI